MARAGEEKVGAPFLGEVLDALIQRFGGEDRVEDLTRARKEFDERRGRVFEDEDLWESWTRSFLEWYVIERPGPNEGQPPAVRALAGEDDPRRAHAIRAWLCSQRALAEVLSLGGEKVELRDLLGGARFSVTEKRTLYGVAAGDVVEVRLVGFEGGVYFGQMFCYHPRGTRDALAEHVRRLTGKGRGRGDVLDYCARLRIRCERYAHVAPKKIYESVTGETAAEGAATR